MRSLITLILVLVLASGLVSPSAAQSRYLFAWVGDGAHRSSDLLAVIDADPASRTYGHPMASVDGRPWPGNARMAQAQVHGALVGPLSGASMP